MMAALIHFLQVMDRLILVVMQRPEQVQKDIGGRAVEDNTDIPLCIIDENTRSYFPTVK